MRTIYLTGFMGVGKTTVGKQLGEQLGLLVYDTDHYIEEKLQNPIPMIFEKNGENYFRSQEKLALQELPTEDVIVTTGGGIILQKDNRDWMKKNGFLIYLHCDFDILWERIQNDTNRPLANQRPLKEVKELYQKRLPLYREAPIIIDTSNKTVEHILSEINTWIKVYAGGNTI